MLPCADLFASTVTNKLSWEQDLLLLKKKQWERRSEEQVSSGTTEVSDGDSEFRRSMTETTSANTSICHSSGSSSISSSKLDDPRRGGIAVVLEHAITEILRTKNTSPGPPLPTSNSSNMPGPLSAPFSRELFSEEEFPLTQTFPPGFDGHLYPLRIDSVQDSSYSQTGTPDAKSTAEHFSPSGSDAASEATTMMIRHVPAKMTQEVLQVQVEQLGFKGRFDFLYIPMDSRRRANRGIAFINFLTAFDARLFALTVHGKPMMHQFAKRPVEVVVADLQGFENNLRNHMKAIRSRGDACLPVVLPGGGLLDSGLSTEPPAPTGYCDQFSPSSMERPEVAGDAWPAPAIPHITPAMSDKLERINFCGMCGGRRQCGIFCMFCGFRFDEGM